MCALSFPSMSTFRDDHHMNMMKNVAGDNELSTLTIPNLKVCIGAEHNTFIKAAKQVVLEHWEESHQNKFAQFAHDGATLKNKDKYQAMGM